MHIVLLLLNTSVNAVYECGAWVGVSYTCWWDRKNLKMTLH